MARYPGQSTMKKTKLEPKMEPDNAPKGGKLLQFGKRPASGVNRPPAATGSSGGAGAASSGGAGGTAGVKREMPQTAGEQQPRKARLVEKKSKAGTVPIPPRAAAKKSAPKSSSCFSSTKGMPQIGKYRPARDAADVDASAAVDASGAEVEVEEPLEDNVVVSCFFEVDLESFEKSQLAMPAL